MSYYNPYWPCQQCQMRQPMHQHPSTQQPIQTPNTAQPPQQYDVKLSQATTTYPTVDGIKNPQVERKINSAIMKAAQSQLPADSNVEDIISAASQYDQTVLKNDIMSLRFKNYYIWRWAAHGMTYQTSLTLNTKTGAIYDLADLFDPKSNWKAVLTQIIQNVIKTQQIQLITPYDGIKGDESFYLTEDSLVIYYPIYAYTPYYYGILEFKIPYTQILGIINKLGPIGALLR